MAMDNHLADDEFASQLIMLLECPLRRTLLTMNNDLADDQLPS
jgi:hypothetical protein